MRIRGLWRRLVSLGCNSIVIERYREKGWGVVFYGSRLRL